MTVPFRIAIPSKGRLSELSAELMTQAGFRFRRQERTLFARAKNSAVEIAFLRADDIPILCAEGAVQMGFTGSDLVEESGADVLTRLELGVGQVRLAVCVPEESALHAPGDLTGKRVATSFTSVTEKYLARHGAQVHLVHISGSVESMISLGVADAIVDLVETGSTLAANGLRILSEIGSYQTVLIQNPACFDTAQADRVVRRIEGVVIARSYSLLEYNVPANRLEEAKKITPGFNSPTVTALDEAGWFAVRAMVRQSEVIEAMEKLDQIGASAILETSIVNCRL